jgi:hypothetical protein
MAGLAALALPAQAAEIRVGKAGGLPVIVVLGDLQYGDGDRFAQISASLPKSTMVAFDSPGGNLLAGLKIGETMRARGFGSLVPDGSTCASACAIAWLGGTKRYLASNARLGFHAASGENGISAPGNALVGAYMARLGLREDAVYALTAASPYDIAWLDFSSARDLGISVERYAGPAFGGAPAYASTRAVPQVASRTVSAPYENTKGASTYDDADDAPGHPAPASRGRSVPRACPAYTFGGHGGC